MARPLWLRLFGPDGPKTFAEFRSALLTAPVGQAAGDGQAITAIRSLLNLPAAAERPAQDVDVARSAGVREQLLQNLIPTPDPGMAVGPGVPEADDIAAPAAPAPAIAVPNFGGDDDGRTSTIHINSVIARPTLAGSPVSPFSRLDTSVPYALIGDLQTGLVIDTRNKTLMQGGPGDYPELLAGPNDTLELDGDFSAGFGLDAVYGIAQVILHEGNDYNLIVADDTVAAGTRLTVNAMPLGDSNHVLFDGSAETDASFLLFGSDAGDMFLGGAGNDRIYGLGGGDVLSGGGGSDTFVYYDAAHSSGAEHDILADFDPTADRIDLEGSVSGFDAAIRSGALSSGSFDADLSAALPGLGAGRAVLYAPDAGDLAGNVFLIVDANGIAGYQEGEDYVFALAGATLEDLAGHTGFFI